MMFFRRFTVLMSFSFGITWLASAQEPLAVQKDFNVELISNAQIEAWPEDLKSQYQAYSDVWGYVGLDGQEFAIIGAGHGTLIYDLADPGSPQLIATIPGSPSRWRDFKSYGAYIYAVADEGTDGLLIIDMTNAPFDIQHKFWKPDISVRGMEPLSLNRCHNAYVDSTFLFLAGCRPINGGGVLIFDLSDDPSEPRFISAGESQYSHDVYAKGDRMFSSDLKEGVVIYDISDIQSPSALARQETTSDFTHNAWADNSNGFLYTTDEVSGATVDAYDIRNIDEIRLTDTYKPRASARNRIIPHNVHYLNDYLVVSYYADGLKIVDVSDPTTMTEVGSYDTHNLRDDGYRGAWGAFPYLPSGLILVSDMQTGLYVLQPDYQRACQVRGRVTDIENNAPLQGVKIEVQSSLPGGDESEVDGLYRFGFAGKGLVSIKFSKHGYRDSIVAIELSENGSNELDIALTPLKTLTVSGQVIDESTNQPLVGAKVRVSHDQQEIVLETDNQGGFTTQVFEGTLTVAAGAWGFIHDFIIVDASTSQEDLELRLNKGYRDDFHFDFGWSVNNSSMVRPGQGWERNIPRYAIYNAEFANPNGDLPGDLGRDCFITGASGTLGGNLTDTSILISPEMDLTQYQDPYINYFLWFYDNGVFDGDDKLDVFIGNGEGEVLVEQLTTSISGWREQSSIRIKEHLEVTPNMYLKISAADVGEIHIYEAGIDAFSVTEGLTTQTEEFGNLIDIKIFPNPASDFVKLESLPSTGGKAILFDILGNMRLQKNWNSSSLDLDISSLTPGAYFIQIVPVTGHAALTIPIVKY